MNQLSENPFSQEICPETISEAIALAMEFCRSLWKLVYPLDWNTEIKGKIVGTKLLFNQNSLNGILTRQYESFQKFLDWLKSKEIIEQKNADDNISLSSNLLNPAYMIQTLIGEKVSRDILLYHMRKNIRERYGCISSPKTIHLFNRMAKHLNAYINKQKSSNVLNVMDIERPTDFLLLFNSDNQNNVIKKIINLLPDELINEIFKGDNTYCILNKIVTEINRMISNGLMQFNLRSTIDGEQLINEEKRIEISSALDHGETLKAFQLYFGEYFQLKSSSRESKYNYRREIVGSLLTSLEAEDMSNSDRYLKIDLFVECSRLVGFLRHSFGENEVSIRTKNYDAEYLFSCLFGFPTNIKGFDELFGGGGLMLNENQVKHENITSNEQLRGRIVLIKGRYGTGKTLLALSLASEVARKGGLCWYLPLEQQPIESKYAMESMGWIIPEERFDIKTEAKDAASILQKNENPKRGCLLIYRPPKDSQTSFLESFEAYAKQGHQYGMRVLIVDPTNSIIKQSNIEAARLRADTDESFKRITESGTNIILISEHNTDPGAELFFEENIADTVILLSTDEIDGYSQRFIEVKKSRFQREQRGQHPFTILPGEGIRIYASSSAVMSRIRSRETQRRIHSIIYGLPSLDDYLGQEAINTGDIIVLEGPNGTLKTSLGLMFLSTLEKLGSEGSKLPHRSLFVAVRDNESMVKFHLNEDYLKKSLGPGLSRKKIEDIIICTLPQGHVAPGNVLQILEDEFSKSYKEGYIIDRILIDDVAHWEIASPIIAKDPSFSDTLIDFLRRRSVTSLLICSEPSNQRNSYIQKPIIDSADILIKFEIRNYKGAHRIIGRIVQTPHMKHSNEPFEVILDRKGLRIDAIPLLRLRENGEIAHVGIKLFLHCSTEMQRDYNYSILEQFKATISHNVELLPAETFARGRLALLGRFSNIDEIQVIQIDEFHIPSIYDKDLRDELFYKIPESSWDISKEWAGSLVDRVYKKGKYYLAVPMVGNISLMAYKSDKISNKNLLSWDYLKCECIKWEKKHSKGIFFDFPKVKDENYNCLFWEILCCLNPLSFKKSLPDLLNILDTKEAIEAAIIYHKLCRRAYLASEVNEKKHRQENHEISAIKENISDKEKKIDHHIPIIVNPNAIVWRHWYSTLNQMMRDMDPQKRRGIKVTNLPGNITVAGDWYLAIPSNSAFPKVALEIVKTLTSVDSELERLELGVGIPTRKEFYRDSAKSAIETQISPYFSLPSDDLNKIIQKSIHRSTCGYYSKMSGVLAFHLKKVIEIPDLEEKKVKEKIESVFHSLLKDLSFVDLPSV